MDVCKLCDKEFNDYQGKLRTRCGPCNTKIRRYRAKAAALQYLGGKCVDCGWSGNQAALQFHHLEPNHKDFTIGNVANRSWEVIKKELQKCALVRANCHSIRHSTKDEERFLAEAAIYRGKRLTI